MRYTAIQYYFISKNGLVYNLGFKSSIALVYFRIRFYSSEYLCTCLIHLIDCKFSENRNCMPHISSTTKSVFISSAEVQHGVLSIVESLLLFVILSWLCPCKWHPYVAGPFSPLTVLSFLELSLPTWKSITRRTEETGLD